MKKYLIIKKLKKAGYTETHGSKHDVFKKDGFPPIMVGRHNDIPERTARNILKAAGIKS
jgi:predicted RNA binding protein YcfA (HicA-like mRNA interferase family)